MQISELRSEIHQARRRVDDLPSTAAVERERALDAVTRTADRIVALEADWRAAVAREHESNAAALDAGEPMRESEQTGEQREMTRLARRASLRDVIGAALGDGVTDGATAELQQHDGLQARDVPWALLAADVPAAVGVGVERRADVVTPAGGAAGEQQRDVLGRVFAMSALQALGVRMVTVPVGDASFPIITTGQAGAITTDSTATDATAGALTANVLEPRRLSAAYVIRQQDVMRVRGLETALRDDLRMTLVDKFDSHLLGAGDATLRGFLATAANGGVADVTDPTTKHTYATGTAIPAAQVDGKYASGLRDVSWVIGKTAFALLAGLVNTGSGQTAAQYLQSVLARLQVTANLPAAATNIEQGLIYKRRSGVTAAIAPVWSGVRLIRDEASKVGTGEIRLTAIAFYSFKMLRKDAYARSKLKTA